MKGLNFRQRMIRAIACIAIIASCTSMVEAKSSDELASAAKAEGKLTFYASNHPDLTARLVKAFNATYPGISVEVVRLATGPLGKRYAAEAEAGNVTADLLQLADPLLIRDVAAKGYLSPVDNLTGFAAWPADYKNEFYVVGAISLMTISYNTDLVQGEEIPKAWTDLLHPRFKGQILMADIRHSPATLDWLVLMEKTYGPEFVDKLAAQDIRFVASTVPGTQLMSAGEAEILAPNQRQVTFPVIDKGGPVGDVLAEPTVAHESFVAISKGAKNPNAAKLFLEFMMTMEGQEALNMHVNSSALPDVPNTDKLPQSFRRADLENSIKERARLAAKFGLN
ncbi:MAG: extracellular solute-binding protein [Chelatococcus sp.]|jgi:iron(III) transport system substrate-binding protein|uniref:ABC transporter substrate-binding protein n=1 Tax=unclassified Chelatococcus TaxID=2638111 RepID=UPI001BCCDBFB|nr:MULTISPECIES: extracellular solute-binding protein [unclassified Chelatococcus]CAH1651996.1 Extracellular solute-binding protein [Hyphomicrobiales bacterium]MBS7743092.1 extracellular solute-binding protein [Chelatococcus sp. HY11]MBX3540427.1 extracellular solute-binding protein [Chelatococcus sp.]MBX3541790.1 extracellular solute-binding protein [Chelatococcus sp.]MCO5074318.1 extracellular solute-binding protein [Chelatococcus sp.]